MTTPRLYLLACLHCIMLAPISLLQLAPPNFGGGMNYLTRDSIPYYYRVKAIFGDKYLKGNLSTIHKRDSDNWQAQEVGKDKKYYLVTAQAGEKLSLMFPNNNFIFLNSKTKLACDPGVPTVYGLEEGEVLFQTAQSAGFTLRDSLHLWVSYNSDVSIYKDSIEIRICLLSGQAQFYLGHRQIILEPGQNCRYWAGALTYYKTSVEEIKCWTQERFNYQSVSYKDLMRRIANWYDKKLIETDLPSTPVSFRADWSETLSSILNKLNKIEKTYQWVEDGSTIHLIK